MDTTPLVPGPAPASPGDAEAVILRDQQIHAIVQSLRVVYGSVQAHSHWVEQQCGVSATQLWAMWELHDAPGQKVTELALALSVHPSNCSNMVDKLRRKGLIRKQRSGPDQRVVRLYVTGKGEELLATAPRPTQGALLDALQRLPDSALVELERGLHRLLGVMKVKDASVPLKPVVGT